MKIWSDVEYVYRCLADRERTPAFEAAIRAAVKPGDVVLDLGTGSGIMALFAARAGARKVFAVEIGSYLAQVSRQSFVENDYGQTIVSLRMDARDVDLTRIEKPDVVICEMMTTGLIGEPQIPVITALKNTHVIDSNTRMIPSGLSTSIALVNADFSWFGMQLTFPLFVDYFTRSFDTKMSLLSGEKVAHSINFASEGGEDVSVEETMTITEDGQVNGLFISSITRFDDGSKLGPCVSLCQPVILPVTGVNARAGDTVKAELHYRPGGGFDSLSYRVFRE